MSERFRLPNISGANDTEKIEQIKRYLYQLALQLDRMLEGGTSRGSVTVIQTEDAQTLFAQLKPLILQSKDIADSLKRKLESKFADKDDIVSYVGQWLQPEENGVDLGFTKDKSFVKLVAYREGSVILYQNNMEAARFADGVLTIVGGVRAQSFNGVFMQAASPGNMLTIQTMFESWESSGNQIFFIFGIEGGFPFSTIIAVSGDGEIDNGYFAQIEAGENGQVIISDFLNTCVIISPQPFEII